MHSENMQIDKKMREKQAIEILDVCPQDTEQTWRYIYIQTSGLPDNARLEKKCGQMRGCIT